MPHNISLITTIGTALGFGLIFGMIALWDVLRGKDTFESYLWPPDAFYTKGQSRP